MSGTQEMSQKDGAAKTEEKDVIKTGIIHKGIVLLVLKVRSEVHVSWLLCSFLELVSSVLSSLHH